MEMRVEELAKRSGASVDTVRYYQAKGLLPPPRRQGRVALYDDGHLARIERIRSLQARGFTLATIARILAGELDAADEALVGALTRESLAEEGQLLSLEELAARTSIPEPLLQAIANDGLLVPNRVGEARGLHGRRRRCRPGGPDPVARGHPPGRPPVFGTRPPRGHRRHRPPRRGAVRRPCPQAAARRARGR